MSLPEKKEQNNIGAAEVINNMPPNLWDKYPQRLEQYDEKRSSIHAFMNEKLKEKIDFGITSKHSEKKTLMKAGAEKMLDLMECRIKIYPDYASWEMLGRSAGIVCKVGYIIDQSLLRLAMAYLRDVGFEHEERVIKILAWGEGRGACEVDEICYGPGNGAMSGKPLKGSANRSIKMAEKRCVVDAVIRTFGLEFSQDPEYADEEKRARKSYKKKSMQKQQPEVIKEFRDIINFVNEGKHNFDTDKKKAIIENAKRHMKNEQALRQILEEIKGGK